MKHVDCKCESYTDLASLISGMVESGTSIEDIATLVTDALNAETKRQEEKKKNVAKEKDAVELMKLIAAFLATHYGDTTWDESTITSGAKEFVTILDEVYKVMPAVKDIFDVAFTTTKPKIKVDVAKPDKGDVADAFDPMKVFEDFIKNL